MAMVLWFMEHQDIVTIKDHNFLVQYHTRMESDSVLKKDANDTLYL